MLAVAAMAGPYCAAAKPSSNLSVVAGNAGLRAEELLRLVAGGPCRPYFNFTTNGDAVARRVPKLAMGLATKADGLRQNGLVAQIPPAGRWQAQSRAALAAHPVRRAKRPSWVMKYPPPYLLASNRCSAS